jgi:hypothetical protein
MESHIPIETYKESLSSASDLSTDLKRILRRKRLYENDIKNISVDLTKVSGLKSIIIPYEIDDQADPLTNFIEVVKSYCSTIEQGFNYDSIMLYSGISGTACTLQVVGEKHQITRERVRQVRNIHINKIKKILSGLIVNGLKCDSLVLKQINDFRDKFFSYTFLKDKDIDNILKSENISLSKEIKPHLLLFFDIFDIKYTSIMFCYLTRKITKLHKIRKLFFKIKDNLYDGIEAKSLLTIAKKFNITCNIAKAILYTIPEIEEVEKHKYQIKSSELSAVDLAYRILTVAKNPLNYQDIINAINGLRDKPVISISLSSDGRFDNIGLTGLWTLKSSKVNKDYMYELIRGALLHFNRPCSAYEIYEYLKSFRPDAKLKNIKMLIRVYTRKYYLHLKDGRVILVEWKKQYKKDILNLVRRPYHRDITSKFDINLCDILSDKTMTCGELSAKLSIVTGFDRDGCLNRIYKSKFVLLDRHSYPVKVSLIKNHNDLLYNKINSSRDKVINTIFDIFKRENKTELTRAYIIEEVLKIHNVSKSMLYVLLRDKSKFLIKGKCDRSFLVSLNTGFKNGQ